jgi:hypothetical protein
MPDVSSTAPPSQPPTSPSTLAVGLISQIRVALLRSEDEADYLVVGQPQRRVLHPSCIEVEPVIPRRSAIEVASDLSRAPADLGRRRAPPVRQPCASQTENNRIQPDCIPLKQAECQGRCGPI